MSFGLGGYETIIIVLVLAFLIIIPAFIGGWVWWETKKQREADELPS